MKKSMLMGVVGLAGVLTAGVAYADSWTIWGRVIELSTVDSEGYRVVSSASIWQNPAGSCTGGTDYYEELPALSPAEVDTINKTLMSAFLAGKKVRLLISSSACGPTNRPAYIGIRVHESQ